MLAVAIPFAVNYGQFFVMLLAGEAPCDFVACASKASLAIEERAGRRGFKRVGF